MTLIFKLDLDMVKMYHHTKNKASMSRHSKVIAQTDTQTDTHTHPHTQYENITFLHTWTVINLYKKAIGLMAQMMKLCKQHLSCLRRCFCFSS